MTIAEFKSVCDQVISTSASARLPCPVVVGDEAAPPAWAVGDFDRKLVLFKDRTDSQTIEPDLRQLHFSYDSGSNEVIIAPLTTAQS